jgi:hypothetical protein
MLRSHVVRVEKTEISFGFKLATFMVRRSEFAIKLSMCYTVLTILRNTKWSVVPGNKLCFETA